MIQEKPLVSVVMITYGHEAYINEAIQSVLSQKVDFDVELILANDCSPDNSHDIIKATIASNVNSRFIIRYTRHENNLGMMSNFKWALNQAKGTYIALCDGDDYWDDLLKLQKQVKFMDTNPKLVFSFHNANRYIEETKKTVSYPGLEKVNTGIISKKKLFKNTGGFFPTASAMFKRSILYPLPEYFFDFGVGDTPLLLLAISKGEIGYIDDKMCVYRTSPINWSSNNEIFVNKMIAFKAKFKAYKKFDKVTDFRYSQFLRITLSHLTYQMLFGYLKNTRNKFSSFKFLLNYQKNLLMTDKFKILFRILFG